MGHPSSSHDIEYDDDIFPVRQLAATVPRPTNSFEPTLGRAVQKQPSQAEPAKI